MLTQLLIVTAVCCAFSSGAVFDPYSRRYNIQKDSMDTLLDIESGSSSCKLISGLYSLSSSSQGNLTPTQNATYNLWIQKIETDVVNNPSIGTKKAKFQKIAALFKKFSLEQTSIYSKIQYLNITTWGPVETVVRVSTEWNFETSLELVLPTSSKGNCKLFDLLLSACSGDSEKHQALSDFIESDLKMIVSDKTKSQKDLIKAIHKAMKTKFFVGSRAEWMTYFYTLDLEGYFAFSQWSEAAVTFERETSYEIILSGQGIDCPFIGALNKALSMSTYTISQKGHIKQLMNYFNQTFTYSSMTTMEARLNVISMKFSESIDTSYGYFKMLNSIEIEGFGSWWDLIILSCHKTRIPVSCGCPIPTYSDEITTTEMPEMMTTEMSTEMPTTEMTTEGTTEMSTEGTTEFTTEATSGSTWDSTFSSITFPSTTQGCTCTCEV
jgi:hypothetical protein